MLLHTRALVRRCCLPTQRCCQPSFRGVARPWAVKTANAAPRLDTSTRSYVSTSRCTCSGSDGSGGGEVWRGAHYARPSDVQRHVFSVDVQHQLGHSDPRSVVAEAFGSPTDQPVVFLHGGGQNRWTWERTALEIAPRGFYVVTVDMKGHGDSYWDPDAAYTSGDYGKDLGTFLERSGLAKHRPCLVGASLGGLSILMSDAARGVASAIVLVDITPRMELAGVHRIVSFMQRTAASGFATLQEASAAVASYQQHRNREPRTQEQLQSLRKVLRQQEDGRWRWHWDPAFISGPKARMAVEGAEDDADNHKWLEQSREAYIKGARCISSPCLILRGRESDLVSLDGVKDFLAAVPHAEFVDIADAHHMVAGDSNSVFTAEVLAFLSKLFPSPAGIVSERICVAGMRSSQR